MVDKITPIDDAIKAAPSTWTKDGLDYQITATEKRVQDNQQVVDVNISNQGIRLYSDKVRLINPPLWTPNPALTPQQIFDLQHSKNGTRLSGYVNDPLLAFRVALQQTVLNITANGTKPRDERIGNSNLFKGDTAAIRSGTGDGFMSSLDDVSGIWINAQNGSVNLSASTSSGTATAGASLAFGIIPQIDVLSLPFDGSSITAGATLTGFTFTLYGDGNVEADDDVTVIECRAHNWGPTLTTADWVDFSTAANWTGKTLLASKAVVGWNETNNAANALASQSTFAWFNFGGVTYVSMALDKSYSLITPTGNNVIETYTADNAGTTSDPLLDITYTPVAGASPFLASRIKRQAVKRASYW